MDKIDERHINAAYDLARQVQVGHVTAADAVERLVREHGMNRASASIYVRNLHDMLRGKLLKRTTSAPTFAIYLDRIAADYGDDGLRRAITSVRANIAYYRDTKGGELRSVGAVCEAAERRLA